MTITVTEITSEGIEDQWIAFARNHWEEHVPEEMRSWFNPDVRTIQALEEVGRLVSFIAQDGDTTVGYAIVARGGNMFSHTTNEWTVLCIYTHPAVRRGGVFAKILALLEEEARADEAVMLNMLTPYNFSADGYMKTIGFAPKEMTYRKVLS